MGGKSAQITDIQEPVVGGRIQIDDGVFMLTAEQSSVAATERPDTLASL